MKKIVSRYLLGALAIIMVLSSCKKDEHKIYYESSKAPVLTASSTSAITLVQGNATNTAVKFTWTNPEYRFTTGVNSQDVTYTLQIDTTGANFSSPFMQEISVARDLSKDFTVLDLNTVLTKLNLMENMLHQVEFRLKAALSGNTVPLYSNVIKMVITPYLDVAVPVPPTGQLYITGNALASDWTNTPPASQQFTKLSNTLFTITVPFVSGKQYKFLSTLTQWQPQYGGSTDGTASGGGTMAYNLGSGSDPDAIPTPAAAGNYKITVNFKTGKYTVEKQ